MRICVLITVLIVTKTQVVKIPPVSLGSMDQDVRRNVRTAIAVTSLQAAAMLDIGEKTVRVRVHLTV